MGEGVLGTICQLQGIRRHSALWCQNVLLLKNLLEARLVVPDQHDRRLHLEGAVGKNLPPDGEGAPRWDLQTAAAAPAVDVSPPGAPDIGLPDGRDGTGTRPSPAKPLDLSCGLGDCGFQKLPPALLGLTLAGALLLRAQAAAWTESTKVTNHGHAARWRISDGT